MGQLLRRLHLPWRLSSDSGLAPLTKIQDNYPKYLLTMDTIFSDANYQGIRKRNVLDWLLER